MVKQLFSKALNRINTFGKSRANEKQFTRKKYENIISINDDKLFSTPH